MSRRDRKAKGKGSSGPPFKQLFNFVWKSPAWKALTPVERCAYLEVKFRYMGDNNGMIACSSRDVGDGVGVHFTTAAKALRRLEELGFIVTETASAFSRKDRAAAEYRLTEYPSDLPGQSRIPTREFVNWRPDEKTTVASGGPDSSVQATVTKKGRPKPKEQYSPRYCETANPEVHSSPHATHIDIPRRGAASAAPSHVERAGRERSEPATGPDALALPVAKPDGPIPISQTLAGLVRMQFRQERPCLNDDERAFLKWLVGFRGEATHRKAQQNLSGQLKGDQIGAAADRLAGMRIIAVKEQGRSKVYSLTDAGRDPSLLRDPNQTDLEQYLEGVS